MDFRKETHPAFINLYPVHIVSQANYTVFPPGQELQNLCDWYRDQTQLDRFYKHISPDLSPDSEQDF